VVTNADLARQAVRLGRRHPPRTPGRRAAGMVYAALVTTRTLDTARRALVTFGDPGMRAAAARLLDDLRNAGQP
jgi:hypothetical protein